MRAPTRTFVRAQTLRRKTLPDVPLWPDLPRRGAEGLHIRRQHAGPHVLDFYLTSAHLAIEVDGAAHDHPARDAVRDGWLASRGIRVLRLNASDILAQGRSDVIATIIAAAAAAVSSTMLRMVLLPRCAVEDEHTEESS